MVWVAAWVVLAHANAVWAQTAAAGAAAGAAGASAGEAVVEFIVVPGVAQSVDMGANMQRQHHCIFRELKPARTPGTGGIIAAVATHEMLDAGAMFRHRRARREGLCQ